MGSILQLQSKTMIILGTSQMHSVAQLHNPDLTVVDSSSDVSLFEMRPGVYFLQQVSHVQPMAELSYPYPPSSFYRGI